MHYVVHIKLFYLSEYTVFWKQIYVFMCLWTFNINLPGTTDGLYG